MVLIKLSARHKIIGMGTILLLIVVLIPVITGAASDNAQFAEYKHDSNTETSVTQSYESDARYEYPTTTVTTHTTSTSVHQVVLNETKTDEEPDEEGSYIHSYTEQDVIDIAKVLYHECRGVPSKTEQACVAWTILNRVDRNDSTIYSVVRAPYQFAFYESAPVWDELRDLARDVLDRWSREKAGETNVGRVLPKEYTYFEGRDGHNYFRDNYSGSYNVWDYSLDSPYEN